MILLKNLYNIFIILNSNNNVILSNNLVIIINDKQITIININKKNFFIICKNISLFTIVKFSLIDVFK